MAKKEKKPEKIEREFVVSLVKAQKKTRGKRANRAINVLKEFMKKHLRAEPENVLISNAVNEEIWKNGITNIPRRIKVKAIFEKGIARVLLPNEKLPGKKEEKKKPEKETEEEKKKDEELKKKKAEKKEMEKEAEAMAIKRGTK